MTISELIQLWIAEHPDFHNREWLKAWDTFEEAPLSKLGADCLVRFDKHLARRQLSPQTRRHYVTYARCVCKWAVEMRWLAELPTKPKQPKAPINPVDIPIETIRRALREIPERTGRIVRFALETGCRITEATRLRWEHYEKSRKRFTLPPAEHKTGPRTGKQRRIFLTSGACALIDELKPKPSGFVFLSRLGKPYTVSGLRATLRRHGISSPRRLRHTAAQWWLDNGVTLEDVANPHIS